METTPSKHFLNRSLFYTLSVAGLFILRIFISATLPLMDKTEARYAEIARLMAETNNYISLQIDYGVPFWAKPPLSTWLSALSIEVFGANEFATRFPSLIFSILILMIIGRYAKKQNLPFFLPGTILLTIPEFLLHTGVISTDMSLAFCVMIVMLSFWESMQSEKRTLWNYFFFIGIGLGLLAKGPIILILTIPPLFLWVVYTRKYIKTFKTFSWALGIFIIGIIAVPWYFLTEKATPGFSDYFIVGEHFKRFFDSGWSGDKYGFPKSQPIGMIWVFLLLFTLPWILPTLKKLWKERSQLKSSPWVLFLTLWLLWTPFFFTFSRSLIHPYIMPVLVPIVLLITYWWKFIKWKKAYVYIGLAIPLVLMTIFGVALITNKVRYYTKTDKYLLETIQYPNKTVYHLNKKSYSSQFYSSGNVISIIDNQLDTLLNRRSLFPILIAHRDTATIKNEHLKKLKLVRFNRYKGIYEKD